MEVYTEFILNGGWIIQAIVVGIVVGIVVPLLFR